MQPWLPSRNRPMQPATPQARATPWRPLRLIPRATAIFALSNTIGLGAIKAIREAGIRIPEDISLIAYDDNIYMDYLVPPVTRIGQPVEEMGKLAFKLLYESIEHKKRVSTQIELAPNLITRESVQNLIP